MYSNQRIGCICYGPELHIFEKIREKLLFGLQTGPSYCAISYFNITAIILVSVDEISSPCSSSRVRQAIR